MDGRESLFLTYIAIFSNALGTTTESSNNNYDNLDINLPPDVSW